MLRFVLFAVGVPLAAEVHTMTLRQAVDHAVRANPDLALARLDEQAARQAARQARDPFSPRFVVGSGLAKTFGFPMSIQGSAPSIIQVQGSQFIFNRQQSYIAAQAKENARGAGIGVLAKREDVAWRVASLFLDAERMGRIADVARKELESLQKVEQSVQAAVSEGRELPVAGKRAALNVARARQTLEALEADRVAAETNLALVLGLGADERVRPAGEDRAAATVPASEPEALQAALESNKDLRRLESQIAAKELVGGGERSARLPRVDLVAQYALFGKFNNYEDYFQRFDRHNGQIGASFQLPILTGPGVNAAIAQKRTDISRLRLQVSGARNRITADLRQAYADIRKSESARDVARLDLELAREQLTVNLALMQEGRMTLRQVEESRVAESEKWIGFYDAQYAVERARLALAKLTGELLAQLQALPKPTP